MFEGFVTDRIDVGEASIRVRHGGEGPPVLLLNGHPRTSEADRAAGRRLAELYGDPRAIWRGWSGDVRGHGIDSGHHMAEEAPDALAAALGDFFSGQPLAPAAATDRLWA